MREKLRDCTVLLIAAALIGVVTVAVQAVTPKGESRSDRDAHAALALAFASVEAPVCPECEKQPKKALCCSLACTCGCVEGYPCRCGEEGSSRMAVAHVTGAPAKGSLLTPPLPPPAPYQYVGYPYGTSVSQMPGHSTYRYESVPTYSPIQAAPTYRYATPGYYYTPVYSGGGAPACGPNGCGVPSGRSSGGVRRR